MNALENTAWEEIFSPVARVHDMVGAQEPKTSQIGINEPASCGTYKKVEHNHNEKNVQRVFHESGECVLIYFLPSPPSSIVLISIFNSHINVNC